MCLVIGYSGSLAYILLTPLLRTILATEENGLWGKKKLPLPPHVFGVDLSLRAIALDWTQSS